MSEQAKIICVNGNIHKSLIKQKNCTMCANNSPTTKKEKTLCKNCNQYKKNIKYHICEINFSKYEEDAWEGDALHTLDIIRTLRRKNYSRSVSNTLLSQYKNKTHQVNYLLDQDIIKEKYKQIYSEHKLSSIFEAKYIQSENFRIIYRNTILNCIPRNF